MTCHFSFLADRGLGKCGISSLFAWFVLNCGWCVSKNPAVGPEFPEAEPQGMSGRAFPQGNRWSQGFLRCGVRGGPVGGRRPEGNRDGARLRSPPRFHGRRCRPGDGTGHRAISPAGVLVRTVHGLFSAAPVRAGGRRFSTDRKENPGPAAAVSRCGADGRSRTGDRPVPPLRGRTSRPRSAAGGPRNSGSGVVRRGPAAGVAVGAGGLPRRAGKRRRPGPGAGAAWGGRAVGATRRAGPRQGRGPASQRGGSGI